MLSLITVPMELFIDHLAGLRGAPNGSARKKIERAMSVLNLPLTHTAIKTGDMPKWAEQEVKGCSSMQAVRGVGEMVESRPDKASTDVEKLRKQYNVLATVQLSESHCALK